jgi:transcriptional regulator with XRE-family HTH domain
MTIDAAVGVRLRNLRLRNKVSQTQLGEQISVSFQQIQKYEIGKNRVSAGHLAQFAKFFGVPVAAFYSEVTNDRAKAAVPSGAADRSVVRLVRAFEAVRDKSLRAALLDMTELMAQQRPRRSK